MWIVVENFSEKSYKQTPFGMLPKDWNITKLGEIADIKYGKSKPNEIGNIPVIGSSGVYAYCKKPLIEFLTIIIGRKGNAGNAIIQEKPCWPSDTVFYLLWKNELIDVLFLFYFISSHQLSGRHAQTTIPSLQKPDLANFHIPLPPLPEQRAIAHVLRTVQEAREKTEAVIEAAKVLKKSMMQYLFTYGPVPIDEAEQLPLKETEVGMVPEGWEKSIFGDCVKLRKEGIDPKNGRDYRYIGLEHIISGNISLEKWGKSADVKSLKSHFFPGDILYGKLRPYLDKCIFVDFEGICSTDILVFIPKKGKDGLFLSYLIHQPFFINHATSTTTGVNHPRTSWRALSKLEINLPPIEIQEQISSIITSIDQKITAGESRKVALDQLFQTLLHDLMTAKIRVNHISVPVAET